MNNSTNSPRTKSKLDVTTAKAQPDTYTADDISEMCNHNGWSWLMAGSRHFAPNRFFVKLWGVGYPDTCTLDVEAQSLVEALHTASVFVKGTSAKEYNAKNPRWGRY